MSEGTYVVSCSGTTPADAQVATYLPFAVNKRWTACPDGDGQITLTSLRTFRITGTFGFTLAPDASYPNTTGTRIVSGSFDVRF